MTDGESISASDSRVVTDEERLQDLKTVMDSFKNDEMRGYWIRHRELWESFLDETGWSKDEFDKRAMTHTLRFYGFEMWGNRTHKYDVRSGDLGVS